jgi:hypothetical protein
LHSELDCLVLQSPARGGPPHAATSALGSVLRDVTRFRRRTPWKQLADTSRHTGSQFNVFLRPPYHITLPAGSTLPFVAQALRFGLLKSRFLHQKSLAFVPFSRPAEANDYCRQRTVFLRPTRQSRIASRKIDEVAEVCAVRAKRFSILHREKAASR